MKETIVKINKTKSQFFEKINKIGKPLARVIKKKKKNQINKIRNKKGEVAIDNAEIQRIRRDCYNNSMAIKWITWKKWTDYIRKVQSSKTEPGRNRNYEQLNSVQFSLSVMSDSL